MTFELDKKNALEKIDKSSKGEIDEGIKEIVDLINSKENYYTTSSCAGRIVLIELAKSGRKDESNWLLVKHDKMTLDEARDVLYDCKTDMLKTEENAWLKQEGAILHVCCRNLEDAEKLVNIARNNGFKRTGMISLNKRFVVEIMSTDSISTIIAWKDGHLRDSGGYTGSLIQECNKKMDKNREKLKKLHEKLIPL